MKRYFFCVILVFIFVFASPSLVHSSVITKKVLVLNFDPILENYGGVRLHQYKNWNDPATLEQQYIDTVKEVSHGVVNYQIAEREDLDEFPVKTSGYQYTDDAYSNIKVNCDTNPTVCNSELADYKAILTKYQVCEKLNSGIIDEVWMWGGPFFGFYEANMAGPNAFDTNGPVVSGTTCQKQLNIMGFNYERTVSEMIEDLGHRNTWTWEKLDKEVQLAGNYGISILGMLPTPCGVGDGQAYNAACAVTENTTTPYQVTVPPFWARDGYLDSDYTNAIAEYIKRYSIPVGGKPKIGEWMLFNEWNITKNSVSTSYFDNYFKKAYQTAKQIAPDVKLSAPLEIDGGINSKITDAFASPNLMGKYHDFLAFHQYSTYEELNAGSRTGSFTNALDNTINDFKFNSAYNVSTKPVWITEGGYGCNTVPGATCNTAGEQLQASDLVERYYIGLYRGNSPVKVDKIFWWRDVSRNFGFLQTGTDLPSEWGASGLMDSDHNYTPRAAYFAYKDMALWYTPADQPQLSLPNDGQTVESQPVFFWQVANNTGFDKNSGQTVAFRQYVIQIDDDQYFTSPVILENTNPWGFGLSSSLSYKPSITLPNGKYYWRVKVEDAKGNFSSWSSSRTIIVDSNMSIPGDITTTGNTPGDVVNVNDFDVLKSNMYLTGTPGWISSDINSDGKVDIFDYNILVGNWSL